MRHKKYLFYVLGHDKRIYLAMMRIDWSMSLVLKLFCIGLLW